MGTTGRTISAITLNMLSSTVVSNTLAPSYRYHIERFDPDHRRFWLPGGFYFEVASWDWPVCADWCWDCSDDFVVYDDTDHVSWYLLYNVHTGVYVHVSYMGT